jgi:hypothetical protein
VVVHDHVVEVARVLKALTLQLTPVTLLRNG